MGPATRTLLVEEPVKLFECYADQIDPTATLVSPPRLCHVTLHAPPHIRDRRAFIEELRAWANVLEAECNHRQASMDRMDEQA